MPLWVESRLISSDGQYCAGVFKNRRAANVIPLSNVGHSNIRVFQQRIYFSDLSGIELGLSASCAPSGADSSQASMRPFPDQVALELSQRSKHMEHRLARSTAGLDLLGDRFEGNAATFQVTYDAR